MAFLPRLLLDTVSWDFASPKYVRLDGFQKVAGKLQHEIHGDHARWVPDEIVLQSPRLRVLHGADSVLTLKSDSPAGFTAAELLFKLHEAVRPTLGHRQHYFGGLTRSAQVNAMHPTWRDEPRDPETLPEPFRTTAPLYLLGQASTLGREHECFACVMMKVTDSRNPVAAPDWRPAQQIPEDFYA